MRKRALWWLGGAIGGAALIYWQIVIAEGAYLGPRVVRLIYRLGAPYYDAVRRPGQAAADAVLRPLLIRAIAGLPRPSVLDVATGTGRVPLLLCAEAAFAGQIAALDLTPRMLATGVARQRHCCPGASIGWHLGEAGALPWAGESFDLVTCLEALEYLARPRRSLAEMARVLRPGGALVVSRWPDHWARMLPGRAFTAAALARELQRLGFEQVTSLPWQPGHYDLVTAWKPLAHSESR